MASRFFLIVIIVQGLACTMDRTGARGVDSREVRHPVPEFMVGPDQPAVDVGLTRPDRIPEQFKLIERMLRTAASTPPTAAIGMRGEPSHSFAHVALAALDRRGGVVTIDDRLNAVAAFSDDGSFRYELGRSGRGEGEYSDPRALAVSPRGDVLVGEVGRRLHVFQLLRTGYAQ